ncbi:Gfo/Idh/MocA family oxidoreductase [Micromonospora sp. NPDC049559]|uniref:Gfo/Idh/MocA family protein n=1 Tax=Micromonospora sp. NPDC049559 TaxID=3155923 RepID=UPI0034274334
MAAERIRVAVAGLGVIARTVHLPLLERRADLFEVVAVADLSATRAAELGARYGVAPDRRHTDVTALLDAGGFDALLLLTTGSHGELAAAALRRGIPVLVEKPLAYTVAETEELARLAAGGARLMVGYMKQYDPAVTELRRRLDEIGGAAAVHAVDVTVLHPSGDAQLAFAHLPPAPADLPAAEVDRLRRADDALLRAAIGADPRARALYQILVNSVSHDLSLLRLLTGAPATVDHVATWRTPAAAGGEPSVDARGGLPGGARYAIGWHYLPDYPGYRETVAVHHARGSFELVFPSPYLLAAPTVLTVLDERGGVRRRAEFSAGTTGFERQLVAFHAMVTDGTPPHTGVPGGTADIATSQRMVRRFGTLAGVAVGGEAAQA